VRGRSNKPPRVVIYGVGGIGKTTAASEAPNPIFLCTEEGTGALDVARFELEPGRTVIQSWVELLDCIEALLTQDHDYQTVVIDSIDFAEPLLWQYVCDNVADEKGRKVESIVDYGFMKGERVHAPKFFRELLAGLDALHSRGIGVILIAHNKIKRFEPPDAQAYDRYQLKLDDAIAALAYDWADVVLFAQQKVHVKTEGKGFDERTRAIGSGERILYTEERPAWQAKNRYGLPSELPLSWAAFQEAIEAARGAVRSSVKTQPTKPANQTASQQQEIT
jgi:hypothetical protein